MAAPIREFRITRHAVFEMERRGIDKDVVERVLSAPGQRIAVRPGRDVLQSKIAFGQRMFVLRVFVDVDRQPAEVVTVYRTSNIAKYWRDEI